MAIHSSILAWKIPWTEEPGGLKFMGSQRVRHDWATEHAPTQMSVRSFILKYGASLMICVDFLSGWFAESAVWVFPTNTVYQSLSPFRSVQFSSVTQSYPTLCDPMNCSMPGLPVLECEVKWALESITMNNSSWAVSNPEWWFCESAALNMPANLENSAVATGLEKVSFHSNS